MTNEEEVRYYRELSNQIYSEALDLMEKADEMFEYSQVLYWMDRHDKEGV